MVPIVVETTPAVVLMRALISIAFSRNKIRAEKRYFVPLTKKQTNSNKIALEEDCFVR